MTFLYRDSTSSPRCNILPIYLAFFLSWNDSLKQISPQPELFELRRVLTIPKDNIEARHDYMLSVIKDRLDNTDIYEREYFSNYPHYGYSRMIRFSIDNLWELKKKKYFPGRRRIEPLHQIPIY